jgi:hypothetical protein
MKDKTKDSCMEIWNFNFLLPIHFAILMFVIKHKDLFTLNMEFHKIEKVPYTKLSLFH